LLSRLITAVLAIAIALAGALPADAASSGANIQRDPELLEPQPACTVDPDRELFITDLSVVEDCVRTTWTGICPVPVPPATRGAWTFGKLIQGVAGTTDPAKLNAFVRRWLDHWSHLVTVNSDDVPARTNLESLVIDPWETASGSTTLDMTKAPFRLLSIVFRFDLRDASGGYGGANTAGEGRFVFGILNGSGNPTQFTVIFEYGLDASECADIQAWADAAHGLGSLPFGDDYNAALQSITDQFTTIGASPGKLNGSAINQVRTNELALGVFPWELREFQLREVQLVQEPIEPVELSTTTVGTTPTLGDRAAAPPPTATRIDLVQVTVAQTPDEDLQGQQIIADYINTNEADILANQHVVPLSFQSTPFRGGAAPNPLNLGWDGPGSACSSINDDEARFNFSLNTCSGCHGSDTGTGFLHVFPRTLGNESGLSAFLTGGSATDVCGLSHSFGDLERRRLDFCALLDKTCTEIEQEEPAQFVH
jgi:hypothetical protein